jgi:tRNA nucleotidyltransferase (CCA-adding enzyme)
MSVRLRAPAECCDAARLAARWLPTVGRAGELRPAELLDLLSAVDALRRPGRLDALLDAGECIARTRLGASDEYAPARVLRRALATVKRVNAGAIARKIGGTGTAGDGDRSSAIAAAVRGKRLEALRALR